MSDVVRFVSSVSASPTVRLDLNDLAIFETIDLDLTPPDLRRQSSASMAVDGEHVAASAFSNRVVTLTLDLLRTSTDLAATQRQALSRELARPENILEYRAHGATSSVFFRTFRSVEGMRRVVSSNSQAYWTFDVPILAEPFAYGLKETLSTVTLSNNPAAANGLFFDIAAANVKGDVETPLNLVFSDGSLWFGDTALGVRRRGTPSSAPLFVQCESMTLGTDTTGVANGANYSPTSGTNTAETSFATNNLTVTRLSTNVPSSASVDARGTYRVFVKVHGDGALSDFDLRFQYGSATDATLRIVGETATASVGSGGEPDFIDLGLFQIPWGVDPVEDGYSGTQLPVAPSSFILNAQRTSGTSNLVWDFVVFVSADDQHTYIGWPGATSAEEMVVDSARRRAYVRTVATSGVASNFGVVSSNGGWPMITPNQTNRIVVLPQVNPNVANPDIAQTFSITPHYWPRYIDVRPATT